MARTRLVWKWGEGFEEGETPVGPAWIATLDEDGKRTSIEEVAGGEWIARNEAIRLAREKRPRPAARRVALRVIRNTLAQASVRLAGLIR